MASERSVRHKSLSLLLLSDEPEFVHANEALLAHRVPPVVVVARFLLPVFDERVERDPDADAALGHEVCQLLEFLGRVGRPQRAEREQVEVCGKRKEIPTGQLRACGIGYAAGEKGDEPFAHGQALMAR